MKTSILIKRYYTLPFPQRYSSIYVNTIYRFEVILTNCNYSTLYIVFYSYFILILFLSKEVRRRKGQKVFRNWRTSSDTRIRTAVNAHNESHLRQISNFEYIDVQIDLRQISLGLLNSHSATEKVVKYNDRNDINSIQHPGICAALECPRIMLPRDQWATLCGRIT